MKKEKKPTQTWNKVSKQRDTKGEMIFFFLYIRFVVYFFFWAHRTRNLPFFYHCSHIQCERFFFARPCVSFARLYLPSLASLYMNFQCYLFAFHSVGGALAMCRRVAFAVDTGTTAIFGTRSRLSSSPFCPYTTYGSHKNTFSFGRK